MDLWDDPTNVAAFTFLLLALILDCNESTIAAFQTDMDDSFEPTQFQHLLCPESSTLDTLGLFSATLNNFRLCTNPYSLPDDVAYWVKPRSTTWFSRFLLQQYDNSRWLSMFRMTKDFVFSLAELLKPHVEKKNTRYRLAVPVLIRVACTLFKLTHGANLIVCSEIFAIGRSTLCKILREVVHAINDTLKQEVMWPSAERLRRSQAKFSDLCSLPAIVGAIDGVHVAISKPTFSPADYFYFKSGGYSVNCQAVVDADKRFIDLYIGMPGSTNDSRMLRRSTLHYLASHGNLMNPAFSVDGHSPYLIGDLGYPLLPWLMVPHHGGRHLSISESLFNKKLRTGRSLVENAFGILKHCFRELMVKTNLHLAFLPDVILCCAILHKILLGQSHSQVEDLLDILTREGMEAEVPAYIGPGLQRTDPALHDPPTKAAQSKRHNLGVLLTTRR